MMAGGVPFELRIGRRYLRSTGNRFLSFISLMSMVGVAIGVAVLIVVLSVMNGFETRAARAASSSMTSHATLSAFGDGLPDWQALREPRSAIRGVAAAAPFVEGEALLIADRPRASRAPASVRGIDPGVRGAGVGDRRAADAAARSRRSARPYACCSARNWPRKLGVDDG